MSVASKERRYQARRERYWLARYEARRSLRRARTSFRLALSSSLVSLALALDVVLPLTQLRPEPSAATRFDIWCGVAGTAFAAVVLAAASVALPRHAFNVRLDLDSSDRRLARTRLKLLRLRVLERSV
ncbi:hypothetical protein QZM81_19535 [Burkholderia cepacia]|uniref:hypothetical protein n=1 Tax=Burkholderia cepacia TaxID=292 RepID=UPI002652ACB0|nr:hypothetical protein [Burkholderia cepacia]MDN7858000.1 hypothetical protein [Burkholderia cepacia]